MSDLERELRDARPNLEAAGRPVRLRVARSLGLSLRGGVTRWLAQGRRRGRAVGVAILVGVGGAALAATLMRGGDGAPAVDARPVPDWGEMTVLARGVAYRAPDVAMDRTGRAIAVWTRAKVVESRIRPPGGPWTAAETLSQPGAPAEGAAVALSPDGRTGAVVYRERVGGRLLKRTLRLPNGEVVGVPQRRIGARYALKVRIWSPAGGFAPALTLSTEGRNDRDMRIPQIEADGDGRFLVAWTRGDVVETRSLSDGRSGPTRVIAAEKGEAFDPSLVVSRVGRHSSPGKCERAGLLK